LGFLQGKGEEGEEGEVESLFPTVPDAVYDTLSSVYECFVCKPASGGNAKSVDGFESTAYDHITEGEMKDLPQFDHVNVTLFSRTARQGMVSDPPPGSAHVDPAYRVGAGAGAGAGGVGASNSGGESGVDGHASSGYAPEANAAAAAAATSTSSAPHKPLAKGLVLHFHGGGFVSSTSKTHEVYLKQWAHELDCPVVSIDYSLSPQHPYPRALNECFFVYSWALANAGRFGWSGERVCFTGDSAGGNLAVAVALRCVQEGVRGPDGLVIAYPVLCIEQQMSPSRLVWCPVCTEWCARGCCWDSRMLPGLKPTCMCSN
jgi:hypothetical protein